jgi:hypothetical protein
MVADHTLEKSAFASAISEFVQETGLSRRADGSSVMSRSTDTVFSRSIPPTRATPGCFWKTSSCALNFEKRESALSPVTELLAEIWRLILAVVNQHGPQQDDQSLLLLRARN